jgi:hypothetical protein
LALNSAKQLQPCARLAEGNPSQPSREIARLLISTRKSRASNPASSPVEHDVLITTLPNAIRNTASKSQNSRMSPGVMTMRFYSMPCIGFEWQTPKTPEQSPRVKDSSTFQWQSLDEAAGVGTWG